MQTQGKSFVHHNISSLVMHDITVHIILVSMLVGKLSAHLVDVNSTFLLGEFKPDEKSFMKIQWGLEKFYPFGGLLFLKRTVWSQKCSKNIFEIASGNPERVGIQVKLSGPMPVLQMGQKVWVDCLVVIHQ